MKGSKKPPSTSGKQWYRGIGALLLSSDCLQSIGAARVAMSQPSFKSVAKFRSWTISVEVEGRLFYIQDLSRFPKVQPRDKGQKENPHK